MANTWGGRKGWSKQTRMLLAVGLAWPLVMSLSPLVQNAEAAPYHLIAARPDVFAQLLHGQWATSGGWPTYLKWNCDTTTQFCGQNLNIDHKKSNGAGTDACHPNDASHCGQCVDLVTAAAHDGTTTPNWRRGSNAIDNKAIVRGTILATFNLDNRYGPPNTHTANNGHTLIFNYYLYDASGTKIIGFTAFHQNWQGVQQIWFHKFYVNTDPNDKGNAKNYAVVMTNA